LGDRCDYSVFPRFTFWNYAEGFAGLLAENWNARLTIRRTTSAGTSVRSTRKFNYLHPLGQRLRLLGHVGALQGLSDTTSPSNRTLDASFGLGAKWSNQSTCN